jgi:putative intracellular protease/amidase
MVPITIILAEGYSDWEIAVLSGVGRAFYGADIRFVSPDGGPINSAGGIPVSHTDKFNPPSEGVVVVCGGAAFESNSTSDISEALRQAREAGCIIAGICGGTVALARAGLLDNVKHTSNGPGYLGQHVADYSGAENYVDQPSALRAGDIITAPAPAPASFAVEVLKAAGLEAQKAEQIKHMLAAEYSS